MSRKWRRCCCCSGPRGWSSVLSCPVLFLSWWVQKSHRITLRAAGTIQVCKGAKREKKQWNITDVGCAPISCWHLPFPWLIIRFSLSINKCGFVLKKAQSEVGNRGSPSIHRDDFAIAKNLAFMGLGFLGSSSGKPKMGLARTSTATTQGCSVFDQKKRNARDKIHQISPHLSPPVSPHTFHIHLLNVPQYKSPPDITSMSVNITWDLQYMSDVSTLIYICW